ncbi:hypothetical protein DPQ25_04730 [Hydrogeniiclostridium mannosilyticum]|uniref:Uncharacterized protein n=1 Tax=Hydrogeniiclostridium mannosilyticum TaxID=2764322 RepID=A0A328UG15_9FIRM|nr:hypothetical protein DPQ25_04730 [Hydrogeniiclostridium mannosilyticum]
MVSASILWVIAAAAAPCGPRTAENLRIFIASSRAGRIFLRTEGLRGAPRVESQYPLIPE